MVKKVLLTSLLLCAACSYSKHKYWLQQIVVWMDGYTEVYLDAPKSMSDFIQFIETIHDDSVGKSPYEDTYQYLKRHRKNLSLIKRDSMITIHKKNNPCKVIYSSNFYIPTNSLESWVKVPAYFFDNEGHYFYSDSLAEAFKKRRTEVVKKYGDNWELVPEGKYNRRLFPYRLVIFELRDGQLGLRFPADSINLETCYYRELEAMANDFAVKNPTISRIVFESLVLKE